MAETFPGQNKKPDEDEYFVPVVKENLEETEETPEELLESKMEDEYEDIFGIKTEELKNIEGYETLSIGQRAVVLHDLEAATLQEIKESGIKEHREEMKEGNLIQKIWHGGLRKFYIAKAETTAAENVKVGGFEARKEFLKDLVKMTKENGFGAEIDENGEIRTNYASKLEKFDLKPHEKLILERFNETAEKFINAPRPTVGREAIKSNLTEMEYEESKRDIIELVRDKKLAEEEERFFKKTGDRELAKNGARGSLPSVYMSALREVADIEKGIQMTRFLNTNPEVEKSLENIKSQKYWKWAVLNGVTERIAYTGGGYLGNMLLTGVFATLTAPVLAAVSGGIFAMRRSIETLRQDTMLAKAGGESKILGKMEAKMSEKRQVTNEAGEEVEVTVLGARAFVEAKTLTSKIDRLIQQIQNTDDETKKAELRESLDKRLYYTEYVAKSDLIGYSNQKDRLTEQYNLAQKTAEAKAWVMLGDKTVTKNFQARIEKNLISKAKQGQRTKLNYIVGQAAIGAAIGASFAFLGSQARNMFFGGRGAAQTVETTPGAKSHPVDISDTIKSKTTLGEMPVPMKAGTMEYPAAVPDATPDIQSRGGIMESIGKGGSVWRTFSKIAKEAGLSKEEFAKVWSNPESVFKTPDGREIPISRMGLVETADKVAYIPGSGGQPGHLEFINVSKEAGDNRALYEQIVKERGKMPSWLQEIFGNQAPTGPKNIPATDIHPMETYDAAPYRGTVASELIPKPAAPKPNDLLPDFLKHKPQIPEIEAVDKPNMPPPIEQTVPGKSGGIIEQIKPGEIRIKGESMEGVIRFNYDNLNHVINMDETHFKELLGTEALKEDYLGILRAKTIAEHMANQIGNLRDGMRNNGLELYKYLKVYENISKNPAYAKETSYVVDSIKYMIKEMTQKYGDVIDQKALPEIFRQAQ
jgi:hypothetical protein